jgi:carbon-monoxide dehydrogenase small subunit
VPSKEGTYMKQRLELKVNGQTYDVLVDPWQSLADVLREELGYTGVKVSCNSGNCGSCTVLLDGKAVKGCIMLALLARGKEILTIEGLATESNLHPLILMAKALLDENPDATEDEIRVGLVGNLCRCTGYVKIVEAIMAAKEKMKVTSSR